MEKQLINDALDIGLRFKSARSLVAMSRKEFCEKHGLNRYTVQTWEIGRSCSRNKSLTRFCEALAQEGVHCSPEWLLQGIGEGPYRTDKTAISVLTETTQDSLIDSEAQYFRSLHEKAGQVPIVLTIEDDAMSPTFKKGERVGGHLRNLAESQNLLGEICIVEIGAQNFAIRRLVQEGARYLLLPHDFRMPISSPESVGRVAEIIWHRRIPKDLDG